MTKFDVEKDYYKVLGVSENATDEQIDRAFRSQARIRHPDGGGSEEEMKALNEAHDVLGDPEARRAYDSKRPREVRTYRSSSVYDPGSASRQGTLEITLPADESVGLVIAAAACVGLGFPLLMLVEMQWMFFLWPLRVMALGALGFGVLFAHSALRTRQNNRKRLDPDYPLSTVVLQEAGFWGVTLAAASLLISALYIS